MSIWILDIYPAPGIQPIIATSEASKTKIDETVETGGVGDGSRREAQAADKGGTGGRDGRSRRLFRIGRAWRESVSYRPG
jgi:hypothetical protein